MIDSLKSLMNMPALMARAREMQEKMKQMQDELGHKQVSADSGGGMVTAVVNGKSELVKMKIDKTKIDVNDTEMLEDLIVAAVNAANVKATNMMKLEMAKLVGVMDLPPGLLPE